MTRRSATHGTRPRSEATGPKDCAQSDLFPRGNAVLSACGTYRYELRRQWGDPRRMAAWIMLNPSTADADTDDATIRRCIGYAKAWHLGGIIVHNLFALRATDPAALRQHPDPGGPDNDHWLTSGRDQAAVTIAAWGVHGVLHDRARAVQDLLQSHGVALQHLGDLTRDGHPRHPLYLPSAARPRRLSAGAAR